MQTETITLWKAKRAGDSITIFGRGADGRDRKITGVTEIEAGTEASPFPVAHLKDGARLRLA